MNGLTKHERRKSPEKVGPWTRAELGDHIMEIASKMPTLDGGRKKRGLKSEIKALKKKKRARSQRHREVQKVIDRLK